MTTTLAVLALLAAPVVITRLIMALPDVQVFPSRPYATSVMGWTEDEYEQRRQAFMEGR